MPDKVTANYILRVSYLPSLDKPADAWYVRTDSAPRIAEGVVLVFVPLDAAISGSRLLPTSYGSPMAIPLANILSYNIEETEFEPRPRHMAHASYAIPGEGETLYMGDIVRYEGEDPATAAHMIIVGYSPGGNLQVESKASRFQVHRSAVRLVP